MGELLISKGADINAKNILHQNINSSSSIIIIQSKERNLNMNNKTPLDYAAINNSIKVGELLISKGADINAKDILHQNIISSSPIIVIQSKERNCNMNNWTPLHYAKPKMRQILFSKKNLRNTHH